MTVVWSVTATRFADELTVLDHSLLLQNLFFYLSCFFLSHLFSSGPPWWHQVGLQGDMWSARIVVFSVRLLPAVLSTVLPLWCFIPVRTQEANMKACVWFLFMVQLPPAFLNCFVCKTPAQNSLGNSCFVAGICRWFFGMRVLEDPSETRLHGKRIEIIEADLGYCLPDELWNKNLMIQPWFKKMKTVQIQYI